MSRMPATCGLLVVWLLSATGPRDGNANARAEAGPDAAGTGGPAASAASPSRVRIGINGARRGRQAAACRGYELSYTGRRIAKESERLPDLWWHLGETTGDRAAVKLARPFAFSTVAVDWYVYPGLEGAPCRNAVTIMSQGRALAELRPAATCGALHEGGRPMYVEATVVTLPRPERVTELQLVHSAAPGPATSPDAGYATVRGLTLSVSPEPARPEVQSATGDVHLPLEGRGAHRWVIEETGLFVVPPGGAPVPVRLPASFAKAEGGITPVRLGDTGWYAAAAMAPVGNEGPVTHELVVFDTAAPGPSRLAMTFAHPIGDVWFDDCAQTLRVELEGGPTARLPVARLIAGPGGTASPAAPGAPAPAPETKL